MRVRGIVLSLGLAVTWFTRVAAAQCPQMLQNNEFSSGDWYPWNVDIVAPADATVMPRISADQWQTLDVFIYRPTLGPASVDVNQAVSIRYGVRYQVSFYYSLQYQSARVSVRSATSRSTTYGLNEVILPTTDTLEYTFVATATDPDARFSIYYELTDSTIYVKLDSLFMEQLDPPDCGGAGGTGGGAGAAGGGAGGAANGGSAGRSGGSGGGSAGRSGGAGGTASGGSAGTGGGVGGSAMGGSRGGTDGEAGEGNSGDSGTGGRTGGTGGLDPGGEAGEGVGASSGTGNARCTPGVQVACACPGGSADGVQICNVEGTGFGACTGCQGGKDENEDEDDDAGCGCRLSSPTSFSRWAIFLTVLTAGAFAYRIRARRSRTG